MTQFIIFLLIGLGGIVVGYYLAVRRKVRSKGSLQSFFAGQAGQVKRNIIKAQRDEMEENLNKIREFVRGRESVANDEVEKLLDVSDATAERYLDALEKEGLIRQVGDTGSGARYERLK